jgi:hypothetical protein
MRAGPASIGDSFTPIESVAEMDLFFDLVAQPAVYSKKGVLSYKKLCHLWNRVVRRSLLAGHQHDVFFKSHNILKCFHTEVMKSVAVREAMMSQAAVTQGLAGIAAMHLPVELDSASGKGHAAVRPETAAAATAGAAAVVVTGAAAAAGAAVAPTAATHKGVHSGGASASAGTAGGSNVQSGPFWWQQASSAPGSLATFQIKTGATKGSGRGGGGGVAKCNPCSALARQHVKYNESYVQDNQEHKNACPWCRKCFRDGKRYVKKKDCTTH